MTVSELIKELEKLPQDMPVVYPDGQNKFSYSEINSITHIPDHFYSMIKKTVILSSQPIKFD